MKKAYLLTGGPGVGKTTLIKQALDRAYIKAGGFFTEEIRAGGLRQGFRIVTLDGRSAILAHIDFKSPFRVSKYGVDIESLDKETWMLLSTDAEFLKYLKSSSKR